MLSGWECVLLTGMHARRSGPPAVSGRSIKNVLLAFEGPSLTIFTVFLTHFEAAVIKSAASAASPEGFGSRDQYVCC